MLATYARPTLLAVSCITGLVAALLYDGIADRVAVALLVLPLLEVVRHLVRSSKETRIES